MINHVPELELDAERTAHDVLDEWRAILRRLETGDWALRSERAALVHRAHVLSCLYQRKRADAVRRARHRLAARQQQAS